MKTINNGLTPKQTKIEFNYDFFNIEKNYYKANYESCEILQKEYKTFDDYLNYCLNDGASDDIYEWWADDDGHNFKESGIKNVLYIGSVIDLLDEIYYGSDDENLIYDNFVDVVEYWSNYERLSSNDPNVVLTYDNEKFNLEATISNGQLCKRNCLTLTEESFTFLYDYINDENNHSKFDDLNEKETLKKLNNILRKYGHKFIKFEGVE